MEESSFLRQFHFYEACLFIKLLLCLSVLCLSPFLVVAVLADKRMSEMLTQVVTGSTEGDILTYYAFEDRFGRLYFFKLTPITIIVKLFANFAGILLLNILIFFLP